ncbi:MAG: DnaD domain protein [Oscillospiraceae bacterium]|nr:DnaD domain protein [Oscillospiraceae bacterium]
MKLSVTGSEIITLTGQAVDKLIRAGDGDAALLYLYSIKTHGQSTETEAAKALDKSKGWVASAMAILSRIGLLDIKTDAGDAVPEPHEPREYTEDEVKAEMSSNTDFTIVVDETQRRLGKILSPDDLLRLFGIYDNLRLPPEVILQLITHCINESHTTGDGRSPSIRYIEKAAYTWEREGIFTIEQAEDYLRALEERKSVRGKIRRTLQIKDREFSATEKKYVDSWVDMGFEIDAIELAYDKTVINTGSLSWPYMDTILKRWHSGGIHTAQQVLEKDNKAGNGGAAAGQSGQKHGNPNSEEMERMARILNKTKEE